MLSSNSPLKLYSICTAIQKPTPYSYIFRRPASCALYKRQFWHFPVDSCLLIYTIRKRRKICITCSKNLTRRTHHRSKKVPPLFPIKIPIGIVIKKKTPLLLIQCVCCLGYHSMGGKKGRKFEIECAPLFTQCAFRIWGSTYHFFMWHLNDANK